MASRKAKSRPEPQPQLQYPPQPSDYETDNYYENGDLIDHDQDLYERASRLQTNDLAPLDADKQNLSVLQRHYPSITSVINHAPYTVVYIFSEQSKGWEKNGIEGTLFVCSLTPSPIGADRFAAIVLNRRGLDNFFVEVPTPEEVENTEEYLILHIGAEPGHKGQIFGLWIYQEAPPSTTAGKRAEIAEQIQRLALQAESSTRQREQAFQEAEKGVQAVAYEQAEIEEEGGSVPMGRQISVTEIFRQQREEDSGFSIHNHHSKPVHDGPENFPPGNYAHNGHGNPGHMMQSPPTFNGVQSPPSGNLLDQLFSRAKQGYNGVG